MSGTHGDPPKSGSHSGVSGLTDKNLLAHHFYKEDCALVGIVPGPNRTSRNLPINWEGERETLLKHADITRKPERMENPSDESFAKDELVQNMDTRVASLSYYFGHTQKLLDDISKVSMMVSLTSTIEIKTEIFNLNFCFSSILQLSCSHSASA